MLDLPPPFRVVVLREVGDAFAHASAHADALGAGALVFVGRFDLAEYAIVLEPEEPLQSARLAFFAGMVALTDALAALAPPEKPISIEWPDAILVDGGLVGGARLAWPEDVGEHGVPDWLVFGASIRTVSMSAAGPGVHPRATALAEEGFADAGSERLVENFARYLMMTINRWQEGGFALLEKDYLAKLRPESGVQFHIDERGNLHVQRPGQPSEMRLLLRSLQAASWLDSTTGAPRQ